MAKIITTYGEASHVEYVVVRENSFSRFNAETQAISAVNGVCELTVWDIAGKDVQLIAPVSVKKITTGSAKASKEDVAASLNFYCPEHPEFKVNDESLDRVTGGDDVLDQMNAELAKLYELLGYAKDEQSVLKILGQIEEYQNKIDKYKKNLH